MNSIINLTGSDIVKSFVEVKKDGATFDVPLTSVVGDFAVKQISGTTPISSYILDFSVSNTQNFLLSIVDTESYIFLKNPIIGKIYNLFVVPATESAVAYFTNTNMYANNTFPITTGIFSYAVMFDGTNWYFNFVEYFSIS